MSKAEAELNERLEEMAQILGLEMKDLLEIASQCGLTIVATQGPPIKHPGHA